MRNTCNILEYKREGKRQLGRCRSGWEDNTKGICCGGLFFVSEYGLVKLRELIGQLNDY
jgi:hypothetical protein